MRAAHQVQGEKIFARDATEKTTDSIVQHTQLATRRNILLLVRGTHWTVSHMSEGLKSKREKLTIQFPCPGRTRFLDEVQLRLRMWLSIMSSESKEIYVPLLSRLETAQHLRSVPTLGHYDAGGIGWSRYRHR